jgi:hypothetical protein
MNPCITAADGSGHVYASQFSEGPVKRFETSSFAAGPPSGQAGTLVDANSKALATNAVTHELYVDEGNQIVVFNEAGATVTTIPGAGAFSGSRGVAIRESNQHLFASAKTAGTISEFGYALAPYAPINNPAVIHAVQQAGVRRASDFQVTPNGHFAAFGSSLSLTGFENQGHAEIYRYEQGGGTECASCATTGAAARTDTFLSPYGLNLTDNGKVFFTTQEGLVLSDTNEKRDAYEWSGGLNVGRISTGRSLTDSTLFSASADGRDAFFFTRDQLVPSDENGGSAKRLRPRTSTR